LDYFLKKPKRVPAGTVVRVVGHFDNSVNNKFNPDPTKTVRWGEQTWDEMMMGGMYLSWIDEDVELHIDGNVEVSDDVKKQAATMLAMLDKNQDGMVQKEEVPEKMQTFFATIDSNSDGGIDATEMEIAVRISRR
jgi:hypothetical protein